MIRTRSHYAEGNLKRVLSCRKRIKCFPSTLRQMSFKTQQSQVILDLRLNKFGQENDMIIVRSSISNSSVFKMFSAHIDENEEPAFSNSSGFKSVFEKLHFRDGLVCMVGLTVEI